MSDLINALRTIKENPDRDHVLALVIETRGSVPQCVGAAMLVNSHGLICGTIGGGKMEFQCLEKCKDILNSNTIDIFEFEMNEPYSRDGGPICGGNIKILITSRLKSSNINLDQALKYSDEKKDFYFALNIDHKAGEFGEIKISESEFPESPNHFLKKIQSKNKIFIVGAGHCGLAIAELASWLSLDTYLIDERSIEQAAKLSYYRNTSFKEFISHNKIDSKTAIVLVNKGHKEDAEALEMCIHSSAKYIGMIGSKRKIELVRNDFIEKGIASQKIWNKVYAPIGLDIGAFQVKEIALSVITEVIAVLNDKKPALSQRLVS